MKKWIFPLLCLVIIVSGFTSCANMRISGLPVNTGGVEEIDWENIVLSTVLPAPQSNLMKVSLNDKNSLHADIYRMSKNSFLEYIRFCEDAGFDVDSTRGGSTMFSARNQDGYALTLTYDESGKKMTISLVLDVNAGSNTTPGSDDGADLNAKEIYDKCASAVFYIEIYDRSGHAISSGSGVFISADGKALTNYHVIEDAYSAKAMTNDGKVYTVSGFYDARAAIDMALIQVDGSGFPFLTIGDSTAVVAGQTVFAIGSPKGLDDTISQGIISNANRVVDGLSYIQMTAPISSGSSGGALINGQGLLIGLNTATYLDAQNLNLAVPIHLYKQLSTQTLHSFPVDGGTPEYTGASLSFNTSMNLTVGETGRVTVSADPGNCTEDVTIQWECSDESIALPEWDDWVDWDIDLYVTGKAAGTATVTVSLVVSATDEVLASKNLTVTVSAPKTYTGASLSFNTSMSLTVGETGSVTVSADPGNCTEDVTIQWECSDESIALPEWDDWNGWNIDLYVTGKAAGTATVTISLVVTETKVVLARKTLTVNVSDPLPVYTGTSLSFNTSLNIGAGETGVVTISVDPGNCTEEVTVAWDCDNESIVLPEWGDWNGWDVDLYVTGKTAGTATITISLVIAETDEVLLTKTLTVNVSTEPTYTGASLGFNTAMNVAVGDTGELLISLNRGNCTEPMTLYWECSNDGIVTPTWGEWVGDTANLFLAGNTPGSATITISLVTESGIVLVRNTLTVTVSEMPRRELAFNKLRDWIIANANTMVDEKPAYESVEHVSFFSESLTLVWDASENRILVEAFSIEPLGEWFMSMYFTPSGDDSMVVIMNKDFVGLVTYDYAEFDPASSYEFSYMEGDERHSADAETCMKFLMNDGLTVADYIFETYIPGFSIADLGFTKAANP